MTTTDPRVGAYIAKSAPFARPILRHLRTLIHRGCPEAREEIKWGMPTFMHHGILCGLRGFKAHVAFWFRRQAMAQMLGPDGARAGEAMGQLGRITSLDDLPGDRAMLGYIRQAAKLNAAGGPARPKPKPRPPLRVPRELAAAMKRNKRAAAAFADRTPSCRREHIAWIIDAKRPETRARRVAKVLDWLRKNPKTRMR